jgi:uncharacterized protein with NAD-binding domain and iron-sulfur cluster
MAKRVAIFGGGVAGLSAAHELACRGFAVDVYERNATLGGKARSEWTPDPSGHGQLPGEHGFRFYPFFYRHVTHTMGRIPLDPAEATPARCLGEPAPGSVADNLLGVDMGGIGADGQVHPFPRRRPDLEEILDAIRVHFIDLGLEPEDVAHVAPRMMRFFFACDARRQQVYERLTWWEFLAADQLSPAAQHYLQSLLKCLVAMDARQGNACTIGNTSFQLFRDELRSGDQNDRILRGPTSTMWIAPWQRALERLGVTFHVDSPLAGFDLDPATRAIRGARVGSNEQVVTADYYLSAVPLEVMQTMVTPDLGAACPRLAQLKQIDPEHALGWMVGAQFHLKEDVPLIRGHVFYPHSQWALTTISQAQFWSTGGVDFRSTYGNGTIGGVLSVDVSNWDEPGGLVGKRAKDCTAAEVRREIWSQLQAATNRPGHELLRDDNVYHWHLDEDVRYGAAGIPVENRSRLMIHPPGIWALRPTAATAIPNLFLAGDYVRTGTDLATMEGANEAARRAVNALLVVERRTDLCQTFDLRDNEPPLIKKAKRLDEVLYHSGVRDLNVLDAVASDLLTGPGKRDLAVLDAKHLRARFERVASP